MGGRAGRQPCLLDVGVRALLVLGDGPRPRDAQTAWTAGRAPQAHSWTRRKESTAQVKSSGYMMDLSTVCECYPVDVTEWLR